MVTTTTLQHLDLDSLHIHARVHSKPAPDWSAHGSIRIDFRSGQKIMQWGQYHKTVLHSAKQM